MRRRSVALFFGLILAGLLPFLAAAQTNTSPIFGFYDPTQEIQREKQFLAVPDPKLAEQHLKTLTAAPHMAGSPEDRQTADYVAAQFRAASLETKIVEYRVWMNYPAQISVDIVAPPGLEMHGPSREHVEGNDPYQDDPRVSPPFNAYSPSGNVEGEVVYVNYGRPKDVRKLKELGIDPRGKIWLVRYGRIYRGVKSFVAQENGAAGLILYSDPIDDGWFKGDKYPRGPWRPDTGVQRGSVAYIFEFPGDPTTPGVASTPGLSDALRLPPQQSPALPKVPTTPLSYQDARPILEHLAGPDSPREWQGALPFTYHLGPGPVRVHMRLQQDYAFRTIWDVIGTVRGTRSPDQWVITGNHRDAWVYGAVDPGSGTAAMLEAVHGIGVLLKAGWRPKRTIVFGSWDAEEQGLIGSTEWAEQNAVPLANAVAYFNTDVAVSGPSPSTGSGQALGLSNGQVFRASAVPSLKQFLRDVAKAVPSPQGGSVYDAWLGARRRSDKDSAQLSQPDEHHLPIVQPDTEAPVGDLGGGSDFVAFLQHLGVPAADIGARGAYGVYHSAFDDFAWFKKFGDPQFVYEQQQARMLGLATLRMADADVLPYDYEEYGREIHAYLETAQKKAEARFRLEQTKKNAAGAPGSVPLSGIGWRHSLDFSAALAAADKLTAAGAVVKRVQGDPQSNRKRLNQALRQAERNLLLPDGLPNRPWYKHSIYAPGEYNGYEVMVLPGVTEAMEQGDLVRATQQLQAVTAALQQAAHNLEAAAK